MSQSTIIPRGHHFHFHLHLHKVLPWFFIFTLVTCSLEHYLALVLQLSYFTQSFEVKNSSVQLLSLVGKSQSALGWSSFQMSKSLGDAHHTLLLKLGLLTFSKAHSTSWVNDSDRAHYLPSPPPHCLLLIPFYLLSYNNYPLGCHPIGQDHYSIINSTTISIAHNLIYKDRASQT